MSYYPKKIVSVGGRIKYFRHMRGFSQKGLGAAVGFNEKTAGVRIAQYEAGARTPKQHIVSQIADALQIPVQVLMVPLIDSPAQLMQLLFALEDICGDTVEHGRSFPCPPSCSRMLVEWAKKKEDLRLGRLTQAQYNQWRYELTDF